MEDSNCDTIVGSRCEKTFYTSHADTFSEEKVALFPQLRRLVPEKFRNPNLADSKNDISVRCRCLREHSIRKPSFIKQAPAGHSIISALGFHVQ